MSLFRSRESVRAQNPLVQHLADTRAARSSGYSSHVSREQALTHSAVWACLRLRAGLVSSLPVQVYRDADSYPQPQPLSPFMQFPGGSAEDAMTGAPNAAMHEWLYSSQIDLDTHGNAFGLVTHRDSMGYPARVELVPVQSVTVRAVGSRVTAYTIDGKAFDPRDVWHERQYTITGTPLGMSPLVYGAASMSGYLSAQKFGLDFFRSGAMPSGVLKNTARNSLEASEVETTKRRFKAAAENRDIVVLPDEWEYSMFDIGNSNEAFIKEKEYGVTDVCRFFDVPADLIDAPQNASNVTYANVSQRNLQLLTLHIGPTLQRREAALSFAMPHKYYAQFDRSKLLAMDPETLAKLNISRVQGKVLAPSEARAADGLAPFTQDQINEFGLLGLDSVAKTGVAQ